MVSVTLYQFTLYPLPICQVQDPPRYFPDCFVIKLPGCPGVPASAAGVAPVNTKSHRTILAENVKRFWPIRMTILLYVGQDK